MLAEMCSNGLGGARNDIDIEIAVGLGGCIPEPKKTAAQPTAFSLPYASPCQMAKSDQIKMHSLSLLLPLLLLGAVRGEAMERLD